MDLVTLATLWFFGALLAGGAAGALLGSFSRFELGLGVGLLVPGVVALWFAWQCLADYRAFIEAGPNLVRGEVVEIEDRPVNEAGDITTPVPVVRYTAPDGSAHTVRGASASGFKPDDAVRVLHDPADPQRSRVGKPSQLRGGAIAMLLFGTFPLTVGLWFVHAFFFGSRGPAAAARERAMPPMGRASQAILVGLNLGIVAGLLWIALGREDLVQGFSEGFAIVAAAIAGFALWGMFSPRVDASWCFGMLVLAVNFAVWAFALHLLSGEPPAAGVEISCISACARAVRWGAAPGTHVA